MVGDPDDDAARPAPRWGEYASPEEAAARRGSPPSAEPASRIPASRIPESAAPRQLRPRSAPRPAPRWDRIVTVVLLLLGAWNTLGSVSVFLDFGDALTQAAALNGYTVSPGEGAHTAGIVLLVVWVALLIGAVALSWVRMRSARVAFWVPLAAGGLAAFAMFAVLVVLVARDPGFASVVQNLN